MKMTLAAGAISLAGFVVAQQALSGELPSDPLCRQQNGFKPDGKVCRRGNQAYWSAGGGVQLSYGQAVVACAREKMHLAKFEQYKEFEAAGGVDAFYVPMNDIFWTSSRADNPEEAVMFFPGNDGKIFTPPDVGASALCVSKISGGSANAEGGINRCREESTYFSTTDSGCRDNQTGLTWSLPSKTPLRKDQIEGYCSQLMEGVDDGKKWRLPTAAELLVISHPQKAQRHFNFSLRDLFWSSDVLLEHKDGWTFHLPKLVNIESARVVHFYLRAEHPYRRERGTDADRAAGVICVK